ncbi:MAG: DUF5696 domain-containing protein [Eubacteriales bacterium]
MNIKKLASAALSLVMACGAIVPASIQPVFAAWEDKVDEDGNPIIDYLTKVYATPEEKLADMILVKEQNGHQIWYEEFTGEIAYVDLASGQILFTNPWDVAAPYDTTGSASTKQQLLSQIHISYLDNGVEKSMYSYTDAALRGQILLKNIKNGVRVEYTIGEEQTIRLVPRLIEKSRFETLILDYIEDNWIHDKLASFYTLKDPFDLSLTERAIKEMRAKFPITEKMAVYVCDPDIKPRELQQLEGYIKTFCTAYSYEELDKDHQATGYTGEDAAPPLFKLALEYTITEDGDLEARLPANGIRYDESAYKLKTVTVLPYMGAGSNNFTGYTFIPDGDGTLIRFEDVKGSTYNISGSIYGPDYAYHKISNQHTEVMRWPVYGVVTNYTRNWTETYEEIISEETVDEEGNVVPAVKQKVTEKKSYAEDKGFLAIITEGDSLASLMSVHGGTLHSFNTVYPMFTPRPSDEYNLRASISVGANTTWTVESKRKYTGSYRILYKMLTDENIAKEKNLKDTYAANYMGMANAYRDYLYSNGTLTMLEDTTADIPLYIESFGSMETTKRILSFPVTVDTPLTTFEDIKTMYDELSEAGVGRINFRLTGFANGGMDSTVPYKLKWMKVVGGSDGFSDLLSYSKEKGFGVFPDFDFEYAKMDEIGDGLSLRSHAVKTIDDRYTSKRYYDAATQSFTNDYSLCISASAFDHFYTKFSSNYKKFDVDSISVSTLGTELNSDFDEDEPYNREDSKQFTIELLQKIDADYKNVMVDGGNAYTLPYADHIVKISTNSSKFVQASEAIPFMGIVLHGAKYFAGTPINMEGDISSAVLKAIENGASLYFILSKQNTSELKEDVEFCQYYSVAYDIWKDEVVEYYKQLNDATKDLQTSLIVDHEFLYGERVPDPDELAADEAVLKAQEEAEALAAEEALIKEERQKKYAELHGETVEDLTETEEPDEEETDDEDTEEPAEEETAEPEAEQPADGAYVKTKYTTTKGSIVRVEYEGGVNFLLNYNSFDVTVKYNGQTYTIASLGFVRIG